MRSDIMSHYRDAREEIFTIQAGPDQYYLYAPLRHAAALVNASACQAVGKFMESGRAQLSSLEQSVIDRFLEAGLIGGQTPELPDFPAEYGFHPYEVTLFLTSRCNLRCTYCYADAGKRKVELSWDAAQAAIELVAENAGLVGREDFLVGFHGGGEPTLAWDLMCQCVDFAEKTGDRKGLQPHVHTASNGLLSKKQRNYIIRHFAGINISMDGPREVQDRQRPCRDGSGSFDQVMETLEDFSANGFHFDIRITATRQSTALMSEIVEFLCTRFPSLRQLHIEPAWYCGRCLTSGEQAPEAKDFINQYLAATLCAQQHDVALYYSGARIDTITNRFCGAPGEGFSVMPEGTVSSCYEVCDPDDPRAEIFHYGHYDRLHRSYVFDEEKVNKLRSLAVNNISFCQDCFCRWHCAGDCMAKALKDINPASHQGSERCQINREITLAQLKDIIHAQKPEGGNPLG
ncbi:MAG TPA: radical SAM protein [Syntrophomonadaceae bacterium]|nr:radical SAM protein [Syntrophomonadaceae bacterium]